MPEQQPIPMNLDPNAYTITNISVGHSEEDFTLQIASGNQLRLYTLSPKHAKPAMMLLQKNIEDYEQKFGKLKTELPTVTNQTETKKFGFNVDEERKEQ